MLAVHPYPLLPERDGWFNAIEVVQEWGDENLSKGCEGVINIALSEAWGAREALQGSLFHILPIQIIGRI